MKLIIDAGNTTVKIAVFEERRLLNKQSFELHVFFDQLEKTFKKYPKIKSAIVSSVSKIDIEKLSKKLKKVELTLLSYKTKVPFVNLYKTPQTLGVDRIALVAAAVSKFPKRNRLIIDAGSCITYDFVNSEEEYQGGAIGLGLQMRYKSLHQFTANLPYLNPEHVNSFAGNSTENAIHAGVSLTMKMEILGVIDHFSNKYPRLIVILTGGDADFLSKRLKNGIFVLPNFLIEGLSHILDYNTNK